MSETVHGNPESTDAISNYDGIFKGMYEDNLKTLFNEGRRKLAAGDWETGKQNFKTALQHSKDYPRDHRTLKVVVSELERYENAKIPSNTLAAELIQWVEVTQRQLSNFQESFFELPQGVFFLDIGRPGEHGYVRLLGRKILSDFWIQFKIPELFCSFITADMLLGLFVDMRVSDSDVRCFYKPLTNAEKLRIMKDIMDVGGDKAELIFPFPLLRLPSRCEQGSPAEGWVIDDAFAAMLGCGEERIRAYSTDFLRKAGLNKPILYDPACSTGVFLASLQEAFPDSYTIGQDLSQQMANFAKARVNEAHCGNAIEPKIKPCTADAVYIRFLNSEVVKTNEAEPLLQALTTTVKDGGYFVTFGHTPVLLSSSNFRKLEGFRFLQSIGVSVDKAGIFQYYVLQKNKQ